MAGFKVESLTYSMGFFSTLLKAAYMYLKLGLLLKHKLFKHIDEESDHNAQRSRSGSNAWAWHVASWNDWRRVYDDEMQYLKGVSGIRRRIYRGLLRVAFAMDQVAPLNLTGEWLVVGGKERGTPR